MRKLLAPGRRSSRSGRAVLRLARCPRGRRHRQDRPGRRPAQPRPGRPRVQRRLQAAGQVPGRGAGRRARLRRRRLAQGRVGLRRRPRGRLLHGRRRRAPDHPERPPGDDPEADGQGRRARLPALRRRGPQGQARRQVPRLDRRLLRNRLSRPTRTGWPSSRRCPSTRSPAASSRLRSRTSGTSTSASARR